MGAISSWKSYELFCSSRKAEISGKNVVATSALITFGSRVLLCDGRYSVINSFYIISEISDMHIYVKIFFWHNSRFSPGFRCPRGIYKGPELFGGMGRKKVLSRRRYTGYFNIYVSAAIHTYVMYVFMYMQNHYHVFS